MTFDRDIILARIRRSGFAVAAEEFRLDTEEAQKLCDQYDLDAARFLLGIYKDPECWTCVFERNTYYKNGIKLNCVGNPVMLELMHDASFQVGKNSASEFIYIQHNEPVWIASDAVACSIQNILLLLSSK